MIKIVFPHGLGDCSYFAHQLPLYVRRGHEITVVCSADKAIVFQASGVALQHYLGDDPVVEWHEGGSFDHLNPHSLWTANKATVNLSVAPMPVIGSPAELWEELCAVELDLRPHIPRDDWTAVRQFLARLPRPIVLLHTKGNSCQADKSLPDDTALQLYMRLLDVMPGSLLLLDWDNRVPRLASYRVRHLTDDWERISLSRLMALLHEADLLLGIDSGPLHAARFAPIPTIGMFPTPDHYPVRWCLPRGRQVNVVPQGFSSAWNQVARIGFNIVENPGPVLTADFLANTAEAMLRGPRYLGPEQLGADLQLQQFVLDWERCPGGDLSPYADRDQSYDRLFREIRQRFVRPVVVETGCIRSPEDWRGAGYSTYLLGAFLHRYGGELHSYDITAEHCEFATQATRELPCVRVTCRDSVAALAEFGRPIDVLLLDSWDTYVSGFAEHALRETLAALPWLHSRSLVLFDDTVYQAGKFHGKGTQAVPWLLEHGWKVLYSSYQTLLGRDERGAW